MTEWQHHPDVSRTAREFADAYTLPGWVYSDATLHQREHEKIFCRYWLCAGHVSRLANPGDYFLVNLGPESLIFVADQNALPHAFYNVCRHRGTRLVNEPHGRCRGFLCPYHAWNYGLDGSLLAAPNMQDVKGFDKSSFPLNEITLEVFNGFLFFNLDKKAPPLQQVYSDFPDMTRFGTDELVRVGYHDYQVNANWKLICENYHECYHCALAHPQLHRLSDVAEFPQHEHVGRNFTGGPMALKPEFNTMTMSGRTQRKPLPGTTSADHRLIYYFNCYPTFLYSLAADYILTHYIWPTGPQSCYIETEWFCAKEQMAEADFCADDAIEFWDITNQQDWALCENAMQGLQSRGHLPGRYSPQESCVHDFDRWYVETMFGAEASSR
ncbi:MAG: aromatic ring-hydroxylating dioxygenase subunit alpha [Gammaproteobacteria bacterium]|nr:aromatic ring-hydroxylating dioxygenase subunit alpha [Gammaproteobacteria bacterium]